MKYEKISFSRPSKITVEQYTYLKNCIANDSEFMIDRDADGIYSHFKFEFQFLGYSIIYLIFFFIMLSIFYDGGHDKSLDPFRIIITIPAIIGGLGSFFIIFKLILEGSAVSKSLVERRKFFESMKLAIIKSRNYSDFCNNFYFIY